MGREYFYLKSRRKDRPFSVKVLVISAIALCLAGVLLFASQGAFAQRTVPDSSDWIPCTLIPGNDPTYGIPTPFDQTNGQCLGKTDQGVYHVQFAVDVPEGNTGITVTGQYDGQSIDFIKDSSTGFIVSYRGSTTEAMTVRCADNDTKTATITAKASGKEQVFSVDVCAGAKAGTYLQALYANQLITGDTPPPTTGCIQGSIGIVRDYPDRESRWTFDERNAKLKKAYVVRIKVDGPTARNVSSTYEYNAQGIGTITNTNVSTLSWFQLNSGELLINGLAAGTYTIEITYLDIVHLQEENQGWCPASASRDGVTVKFNNGIRVSPGNSCADLSTGDDIFWFSATTGEKTDPLDGDDEINTTSSCQIEGVGWIVCPAVKFLADITDKAYNYIADQFLAVESSVVSTSSGTYTAWSLMRNVANVAFVIAFLIIIFSQLTGQGIASYGIKKMLPRLIIAAVLVNISFFVCQVAVDLSNITGYGLKTFFENAGVTFDPVATASGDQGNNWVGITTLVLGGTAIAWALGLAVLLPFLVSAVFAVLVTFLILVIRQVLIILLVVLAPIAFVAYILPNTEQWFTKWRKMFVGLLLVFPVIGLLFGAAALASVILETVYAGVDGDDQNMVGMIVAHGVLVLPLFLLPSLLKSSLNSVGNIGAKINGFGSKAGKGLSSKTANSGVVKSWAGQKAMNRAQVGAGIYEGKNPVSKLRSKVNRGLNRTGAFNAVTGGYGTARGAAIDKLEKANVETAEADARLRERDGESFEAQFEKAIEKGDETKARALQNILMGQGGPGVATVKKISRKAAVDKKMSSDMRRALAGNLMTNHAQAAKQKDPELLRWANETERKNGLGPDFDRIAENAETYRRSTAAELSGVNDDAFINAMRSGGVSPETLSALRQIDARTGVLTDVKRRALAEHSYVPPKTPPSTPPPTPPPATPPTP